MGEIPAAGCEVLGGKGGQCPKQAVLAQGHSVGDEEGHGGADGAEVSSGFLPGDRRVLPGAGHPDEGRGDGGDRYHRDLSAQEGLPSADGEGTDL